MRSLALIALVSITLPTTVARRWRFAVPFPGKMEPSLPEPVHKPFDDIEEKEKLFDAKQVSRTEHKSKIVVVEKKHEAIVPLGLLPNTGRSPRKP